MPGLSQCDAGMGANVAGAACDEDGHCDGVPEGRYSAEADVV